MEVRAEGRKRFEAMADEQSREPEVVEGRSSSAKRRPASVSNNGGRRPLVLCLGSCVLPRL